MLFELDCEIICATVVHTVDHLAYWTLLSAFTLQSIHFIDSRICAIFIACGVSFKSRHTELEKTYSWSSFIFNIVIFSLPVTWYIPLCHILFWDSNTTTVRLSVLLGLQYDNYSLFTKLLYLHIYGIYALLVPDTLLAVRNIERLLLDYVPMLFNQWNLKYTW